MSEKEQTFERIREEIGGNDIVLFMKGTPVFPQCGFSAMTVQVLSHLGVKFKGVDILADPAIRTHLRKSPTGPPSRRFYVKAELFAAADFCAGLSNPASLHRPKAG